MAPPLLGNLGAKFPETSFPHYFYDLFLNPNVLLCLQCSVSKMKRKAGYTLLHFHIFIHYLDQIRSQLAYIC